MFSGFLRTSPAIDGLWEIKSLTIAPGSAPFTFTGSGLEIFGGGITNNDSDIQTFNSGGIFFSGPNTITAAAGPLDFNCLMILAGTLNVSGAYSTNFDFGIDGYNQTLNKSGAGTLTLGGYGNTEEYDLVVGGGTVTLARPALTTFDLAGSITVNSGLLRVNSDLVMDNTPLTCAATGSVNVGAGVTFRITNQADVTFSGNFELFNAGAVVNIDRYSSSLTVAGTLSLSLTTLNVSEIGTAWAGTLDLARPFGGTVNVGGSGSAIHSDVATNVGGAESSSALTISNAGFGFLSALSVGGDWAFPKPTVLTQSDGDFRAAAINIATTTGQNGEITITGTGSTGLQTGASPMVIGSASGSAALNVTSGGAFASGTGLTTVNPSGTITINGGTYTANGSITLSGILNRDATGAFNLASGTSFTITGGGDAAFTGFYDLNTAATIHVNGTGSTLTTSSYLRVLNGGALTVGNGGWVTAAGYFDVGVIGNGTVQVDGVNSRVAASGVCWWGDAGNTATIGFSNGATALVTGSIDLARGTTAGTAATLSVGSSANVTLPTITVAANAGATNGTITVTGAGSSLTQSGSSTLVVGATSASLAALNVNGGATFNSGTGPTLVNRTGTIHISGATYNANGDITLDGGHLSYDGVGAFNLAGGKVLTIQNSGTAAFAGPYYLQSTGTFNVTGTGSTLTGTNVLAFAGGSSLNVTTGANISTPYEIWVGTMGSGNGTAVIDGVGSSLSAGVQTYAGWSGKTGTLTLRNNASGTTGNLQLAMDATANSTGMVRIESAADVTASTISAATGSASTIGSIVVTGSGSTLTQSGASAMTLGSASLSTATLTVESAGTFTSGTGLTTVNATGVINVNGGTYNALGNMTLNGGRLNRDVSGIVSLSSGRTLTIQNGGDAVITGSHDLSAGTIALQDSGSTLSTTSTLRVISGGQLNVTTGADVTADGYFHVGVAGNGTVTVDGSGSTLTFGPAISPLTVRSQWGDNGSTGSITFSNGAIGTMGAIEIGRGTTSGSTGTLLVQSSANVTTGSLLIAATAASVTGTVTLTGTGSTMTQGGSSTLTVGAASASTGTLTVNNRTSFTTGTGAVAINKTGLLTIGGSSSFHANGHVSVEGRVDFGSTDAFVLAPTKTMTLRNSGRLNYTGTAANSAAWSLLLDSGGGEISVTNTAALLTLTGDIIGSGPLSKTGTGTLSVTGVQDYDALNVTAGTFNLNADLVDAVITHNGGRLNISESVNGSTVNANSTGGTSFYESQTLAALNIGPGGVATLESAVLAPQLPVPEPGSPALLLLGIFGLFSRRHRRF